MENHPTETSRYLRNPDVVLREEDQDGALLFNPDTSQMKVINHTALFIWQKCDGSVDLAAIATSMSEVFDEVLTEQVTSQIITFLDEMLADGFIGILETQSQ